MEHVHSKSEHTLPFKCRQRHLGWDGLKTRRWLDSTTGGLFGRYAMAMFGDDDGNSQCFFAFTRQAKSELIKC